MYAAQTLLQENAKAFPEFWRHFLAMHATLDSAGKGNKGHGLDHDLMVAGYTQLIAQDSSITGKQHLAGVFRSRAREEKQRQAPRIRLMAWVAALLHSYDRFFHEETDKHIAEALKLLPAESFSEAEREIIRLAVKRHDKFNSPDDSLVQIVLMDADRLANIGSIVLARSGQFNPNIPVVLLGRTHGMERHPDSTYRKPLSVWCDLVGCLEWESDPRVKIRLWTAQVLAKPHFDILKTWFKQTEQKFDEAGISTRWWEK